MDTDGLGMLVDPCVLVLHQVQVTGHIFALEARVVILLVPGAVIDEDLFVGLLLVVGEAEVVYDRAG